MYCKLEDPEMNQNNFSMNTILTDEKQKLSSDIKEIVTTSDIENNNNNSNTSTKQQELKQSKYEEKKKQVDDEKPKKEELSVEAKNIHVTLDESELCKKFKTLTNEIIVTKNGRYFVFFFHEKWQVCCVFFFQSSVTKQLFTCFK